MNREQTEDLKAFELRLTECVAFTQTKTRKWRFVLIGVIIWLLVSLFIWWSDDMEYEGYWEMIRANKSLTGSIIFFVLLYIFGIFERNNASQIVTSRCRTVLEDYNMSCDKEGKLILKRKPNYDHWKPG